MEHVIKEYKMNRLIIFFFLYLNPRGPGGPHLSKCISCLYAIRSYNGIIILYYIVDLFIGTIQYTFSISNYYT